MHPSPAAAHNPGAEGRYVAEGKGCDPRCGAPLVVRDVTQGEGRGTLLRGGVADQSVPSR